MQATVRVPLVLVSSLLAAAVLVSSSSAAGGVHRFFFGPTGSGVDCEVAASVPQVGTSAYCLVLSPKVISVTMSATGKQKICRGPACGSDAPENTPTLKTGAVVNAGPFRCTASATSVSCVVTKTGVGFSLAKSGLTKLP